ncbi:hypothetical protein OPQ81_009147 [Rhizoctonia solani]|nr:hypothetical protein OPQ81_009147 [Rhizoctonia solani]
MFTSHRPSTPIKQSLPPWESRSAAWSYKDLEDQSFFQDVDATAFQQSYLSGSSLNPTEWSTEQQGLVKQISWAGPKEEENLYTGSAPLLTLLDSISKQIFDRVSENDNGRAALVFRSGHRCKVKNPINKQTRSPDIVAFWEISQVFPTIDYSKDHLPDTTWCALAAVGEVKVSKSPKYQLASYLQHYLQSHPELNAALGFTVMPRGYGLLYHDANVIHYSEFGWEPGPLYAFVEKLYTRPFQDTSMQIFDSKRPAWATKIGNEVYVSEEPHMLAGPGQRRYTTIALNVNSSEVVFLKDSWRDQQRLFFEALLLKQAHAGQHLSGLMSVEYHGYVLDESGKHMQTTSLGSIEGQASGRHKMRMITRDIGRPLEDVSSLRQFLCVMYDACVVQRNLYRKSQILHRDISDGNIMLAPDTNEYWERCAKGYAQVKFVNQVLAKDKKCDPKPECLIIDLGNGADLKVERGPEASTERTGTPKFIARSVSSGELLDEEAFDSEGVDLPSMEGPLGDYANFMHAESRVENGSDPNARAEVEFAHQLFHDAESIFWVIAWTLARSARVGYQPEADINPNPNFRRFFYTMFRHYPMPGTLDPRAEVCLPSTKYWTSILHSDLATLGPMLHKMFKYIRPEWAYRPELDPEHVHEALMRLLLAEIVRMDETKTDVPLIVGARRIPDPPPEMQINMSSLSFHKLMPFSRASGSLGPQNNIPVDPKPENPTISSPVKPKTSGNGQPLQQPERESDPTHGSVLDKRAVRDMLKEQGRSLVWQREICQLEAPESVRLDES